MWSLRMQIEYCHAKNSTMQFCRQVSEYFYIYCKSINNFSGRGLREWGTSPLRSKASTHEPKARDAS